MEDNGTHDLVRKAYGQVARRRSSCCPPSPNCGCGGPPYEVADHPVPQAELGLSCGNPLAFGHIHQGDVVLDLGSGAGKDVFLAGRVVGAQGRVIGVDFTPEMLDLARQNAAAFRQVTGLDNVEFRQGPIENLPVDDASVDVVISNCVINLSPDKPRVFREVFRVLKPAGRMVVSDIVLDRPLPAGARDDASLYVACIAGAVLRDDYLRAIHQAGFARVQVLADQKYQAADGGDDPITGKTGAGLEGLASSVTILAEK
jgi:SAM-dependent methyltransferase